jgi:hypothetical protein
MKSRFLSFLIVPATAMFVACGGGKVVVLPGPSMPASNAIVAQTPATPAPVIVTAMPAAPSPPADTVQGASPGTNYVWVPGYYDWRGDHYVWNPGAWVMTPATTSVWVPAHWEPTAGGYTWVAGHWR